MKKIMFILIFCVFLQGCELHNDRLKRTFVLENGTNKVLKIEFLGQPALQKEINGRGILIEGTADDLGIGRSLEPAAAFFDASMVVVTYNDAKKQVYTLNIQDLHSTPATRNILVETAYTKENHELYRFIFTEDDFENAEPIK